MTVDVDDPLLAELVDPRARPERLATGCIWTEGPVWLPAGHPLAGTDADPDEGVLLFSDIPNDRICRWSEGDGFSVWREGAEYTNGHTLDRQGRLLSCSHGHRRIERTEADGSVTPLVTHHRGRRFNSPNDLVVAGDGAIWFTDPPYGIISDHEGHAAESEIGVHHVFRFEPDTGALAAATEPLADTLADLLIDPNGLAFSPDETILYVADTSAARIGDDGQHHILAFDVVGGRAIDRPRRFVDIEPGVPDGFRVTSQGWVVTSAGDGVHVYHPDGHRLGRLPLPEVVSNCCIGGPDGLTLFITATTSLYRIPLRSN